MLSSQHPLALNSGLSSSGSFWISQGPLWLHSALYHVAEGSWRWRNLPLVWPYVLLFFEFWRRSTLMIESKWPRTGQGLLCSFRWDGSALTYFSSGGAQRVTHLRFGKWRITFPWTYLNTTDEWYSRITRYLGCYTAYAVFIWRYVNNPEAWSYVASAWSVWIILLTLLPETAYPFIYLWLYTQEEAGRATKMD